MAGQKKEKKAQRVLFDAQVLLSYYTAWLIASKVIPEDSRTAKDINRTVNKFMKEDEDMVRRFFQLPQP